MVRERAQCAATHAQKGSGDILYEGPCAAPTVLAPQRGPSLKSQSP